MLGKEETITFKDSNLLVNSFLFPERFICKVFTTSFFQLGNIWTSHGRRCPHNYFSLARETHR